MKQKTWSIVIALICVVYVSLRLWNLTETCLWFDEIFSIHAAELGTRNLLWFVAQDLIHPPLFYITLKIWINIGGESLFWLRFFSVLFSTLAIVSFLLLCRELKLKPSAVALALTFFAVSGSLIKYAQEIRMYSLVLFFGLFSMWLFARFFNWGKNIWLLTIVNVLLVYTHYFGWFVILSEVIAVLILQRIKIRQILTMFGITLVSFTPWIFAVWQAAKINADVGQNIGWMSKPNFLIVLRFVFDLFEPIYFTRSNFDRTAIVLITLPILTIAVIAFVIYTVEWKSAAKTEKQYAYLLLIFIFVPITSAFAASWILPYSIWGTRHLLMVYAPLMILTATALTRIHFRQLKAAMLISILALFAGAFLLEFKREKPVHIWCAWENLAGSLYESTLHREEAVNIRIYTFEDLVAYHFWFALRDSDRGFQVVKVNEIDVLVEDKAYFLPRGFDDVRKITENEIAGERFFIAFRDKEWNESKPPLSNLKAKGYRFGEPRVYETQGLKAFLVEVER